MIPFGTDYTCDHGEPVDGCTADGCANNPDTAYLAELDAQQEAKRRAEEHDQAVAAVADRMRLRQEAEALLRADTAPPMPAFQRLDELLARPLPEVRYLVDSVWPRYGRVLLSAQAKTGKTTLRDNLVRVLVDGGRFLDRYDVDRPAGTVAVLDVEMSDAQLQMWLGDQGIRDQARLWVVSLRGRAAAFDILDPARRTTWAKALRARGVAVLVVDCLGPLLAVLGLKESENVDVGRWLAALETLLEDAGVGEALVVHHMGHDGERSRGASRLRDWPDAEWRMLRGRDNGDGEADPTRYFAAVGRDVDEPEAALRYDPINRHLSIAGGSRAQAQAAREVPLLVKWVHRNPGCSSTEIDTAVDEIGIQRNRSRAAVRLAVRQGDLCVHKGARRRKNHHVKAECAECATSPPLLPADSQE